MMARAVLLFCCTFSVPVIIAWCMAHTTPEKHLKLKPTDSQDLFCYLQPCPHNK